MARGATLWSLLWWQVCVLLAALVVTLEDASAGRQQQSRLFHEAVILSNSQGVG